MSPSYRFVPPLRREPGVLTSHEEWPPQPQPWSSWWGWLRAIACWQCSGSLAWPLEWIMLPPKRDEAHAASSFAEHLRALGHMVFVKGWPVVVGGIALAILNVFLYTYRHPWGVVAGL